MSFEKTSIQNLLDHYDQAPTKDISIFLNEGEKYQYWAIHVEVLALYYSALTAAILATAVLEEQRKFIATMVLLANVLSVIYIQCLGVNEKHGEGQRFKDEAKFSIKLKRYLDPDHPPNLHNEAKPDEPDELELVEMDKLQDNVPFINPSDRSKEEKQGILEGLKRTEKTSFEKWHIRIAKMFHEKDSKIFREVALFWNWLRLFLLRAKKVINTFAAFFNNSPVFHKVVGGLNKATDPVFPFLSWLLFLPRVFLHLYLLLCHTFANIFKSKAFRKPEDLLKMTTRACAQILRRWFPLSNDLIWMIAGILACFLFGPAAPFVMILTLAFPISTLITSVLYVYDIGLAAIGAWLDWLRLSKVKIAFAEFGECVVFDERVSYEHKKMAWSIAIAVITCIGAVTCFILPIIFPGVGIPFVGALLLLIMSVVSRYLRDNVISAPKNGLYTGLLDAKEKLTDTQKQLTTKLEKAFEKNQKLSVIEPLEQKLTKVNLRLSIFKPPPSYPPTLESPTGSPMARNISYGNMGASIVAGA